MTLEHEEAVRLAVQSGGDASEYLTMPGRPVLVTIWADKLADLIAEVEQCVARECAELCEAVEDDGGEWDIQSQCANAIKDKFLTGEEGK